MDYFLESQSIKKVAIIPARGGSQRLPGKNIRDFLGKPVIAYSIDLALKSKLFEEVMVSTNDEQIAEVAISYGAVVPFIRSDKNSGDFATLSDVIKEVTEEYTKRGINFDIGCCILPTAPIIQIKYLEKGLKILLENNFMSVLPIVKFSYPIQRGLFLSNDGSLQYINKKFEKTRSQDLRTTYHDAGQFYWFYINQKNLKKVRAGFIISDMEAQDVDTEGDWQLMEVKYRTIKKRFELE